MEIQHLINNDEFSFNVKYRIYEYQCPDIGSEEEGDMILKYDSEKDMEFETDLYWQTITAINQAEDGTIEIEYVGEWLDDDSEDN